MASGPWGTRRSLPARARRGQALGELGEGPGGPVEVGLPDVDLALAQGSLDRRGLPAARRVGRQHGRAHDATRSISSRQAPSCSASAATCGGSRIVWWVSGTMCRITPAPRARPSAVRGGRRVRGLLGVEQGHPAGVGGWDVVARGPEVGGEHPQVTVQFGQLQGGGTRCGGRGGNGPLSGLAGDLRRAGVERHDRGVVVGQAVEQPPVGEKHRRLRVTEREPQALCREGRVQRQVRPACLEDGQRCDYELQRPRQAHRHDPLRAHPEPAQMVREPVGLLVQLRGLRSEVDCGVVPLRDHLPTLSVVEERDGRQALRLSGEGPTRGLTSQRAMRAARWAAAASTPSGEGPPRMGLSCLTRSSLSSTRG